MRPMKHASKAISLGVVLACVVGTMALGVIQKRPCADGVWTDGKQYRLLCYTDIVALFGTEQLANGRLPYLDACEQSQNNCDEYPLLTMYFMRAAASLNGSSYAGFYYANAVLLTICAAVTAYCLWLLAGRRALWFALAPTLLVFGTMNWDLLAVAFATAALALWATGRDEWAGVFLGLGAAAKFYPAFLVLPLFLEGMREREPDRSARILWWSAGTWIAVNLPFAWKAPGPWMEFFKFNTQRGLDWDSLWFIAQRHVAWFTFRITVVNVASLVLFLGLVAVAWWIKARRQPGFRPWTLGFPILVAFLLTNKVYSPQYGLWLLPWFALVVPSFRAFVAFEIADVAVFLTRFRFFGAPEHPWGWPQGWFETAVLVRAVILVACVVLWLRAETEPLVPWQRREAVASRVPVVA
jgi:uncharacterized membrane protein